MARLPSLKAIHSFAAAAKHCNFTAAAEELNVTQGAISRMIQTLELDLGARLFVRNGRFITLTPVGESYYREVGAALERIATASAKVRGTLAGEALRLAVNPGFANCWLMPRLHEFRRTNPKVQIDIVTDDAQDEAKVAGAQLAIKYGDGPWSGLVATRLPLGSTVAIVCGPSLVRTGQELSFEEIRKGPLLVHSTASRNYWGEFFQHFNLPPPDLIHALRFPQGMMLAEAAMHGLGFALVPVCLYATELEAGRLVLPNARMFQAPRSYFLTHEKGADTDDRVRVFKKWILSQSRAFSRQTGMT